MRTGGQMNLQHRTGTCTWNQQSHNFENHAGLRTQSTNLHRWEVPEKYKHSKLMLQNENRNRRRINCVSMLRFSSPLDFLRRSNSTSTVLRQVSFGSFTCWPSWESGLQFIS